MEQCCEMSKHCWISVACGLRQWMMIVICWSVTSHATMMSATYKLKVNSTGSPVCSTDQPTSVVRMASAEMSLQCAMQCMTSSWSMYQFKTDQAQCELYANLPSNFAALAKCTAYVTDSFAGVLTIANALPQNNTANGIQGSTLLNDLLFITVNDNRILVFNATSLQSVNQLLVNDSSVKLLGVVANPVDNNVYASDNAKCLVYFFSISNMNAPSQTWTSGCYPYLMSVDPAGNLIIALSYHAALRLTVNGKLANYPKTLYTTPYYPTQAVIQSNGILVSTSINPSKVHGIFTVTTNGQLLRCYGNQSGSGLGQMQNPRSLALDKDGYILVTDTDNNRLLLVNPSLTDSRQIPLPGNTNLQSPYTISLDQKRGRLYVGEGGGQKRMLVFDYAVNLKALFNH